MIAVVDYGMGNLRNVRRAVEQFGVEVAVTNDLQLIGRAEKLILPGVGAFGEAVKRIDSLGLRESILGFAGAGRPLLGVCLGMQLFFDGSEESPGAVGLGMLPGLARKFPSNVKVPHIGWNDLVPLRSGAMVRTEDAGNCFYFVHSFFVPESTATLARTTYGLVFTSVVEKGNLFGTQFHPEKSQNAGKALLERFVAL
jgi:glutamine amidotransferase